MLFPIGIQEFAKLRKGGFAYVDKTRHLYELVHTGMYYFLGRPRRFGKSLLLSTIEAYFLGQRELFKGLAIEALEQEWETFPVLRLDLNTGEYSTEEELRAVLDNALGAWESLYGKAADEPTLALRFKGVIQRACERTGRQVVVLVDEYDKPLLQALRDEPLQDRFRSMLKAFYSVLKTQDRYLRFALLTGVSKFGKVSIFSDLNNLRDISLNKQYATLCGITEQELLDGFDGPLREMAKAQGMTYDEVCQRLRRQYDGYHFAPGAPGVYNPFSLMNALQDRAFQDYWFETGTPSFLVELLQGSDYELERLQSGDVEGQVLGSVASYTRDPLPIIYQTGYLTIKGHDREFDSYTLAFPNEEVRRGFIKYLLPHYLPRYGTGSGFSVRTFVQDVRTGQAERFVERMQAFFASTGYEIVGDMEKYFHNAFYLFLTLMGFYTEVERQTSRGRVDAVLRVPGYTYVLECKLDRPADEALRQIDERGCTIPFQADGSKLFKVGISFSSKTRGMEEYRISEE